MVAFLTKNFAYEHDWALVNQGIWRKYPNRQCEHVVSVDTVDRSVDPKTGIIRTERILGVRQKTPVWVLKLLGGSEDAFVREVSFVDPLAQTTTITSVNLSLSQYVTILEQITYRPDPQNALSRTNFVQSAEIQARMRLWKSVGDRLEDFCAQRFGDNAEKGKTGFEEVLRNMWQSHEEQDESAHEHS